MATMPILPILCVCQKTVWDSQTKSTDTKTTDLKVKFLKVKCLVVGSEQYRYKYGINFFQSDIRYVFIESIFHHISNVHRWLLKCLLTYAPFRVEPSALFGIGGFEGVPDYT